MSTQVPGRTFFIRTSYKLTRNTVILAVFVFTCSLLNPMMFDAVEMAIVTVPAVILTARRYLYPRSILVADTHLKIPGRAILYETVEGYNTYRDISSDHTFNHVNYLVLILRGGAEVSFSDDTVEDFTAFSEFISRKFKHTEYPNGISVRQRKHIGYWFLQTSFLVGGLAMIVDDPPLKYGLGGLAVVGFVIGAYLCRFK